MILSTMRCVCQTFTSVFLCGEIRFPSTYIDPLHIIAKMQFYVKDLYIFVEGPGDDSSGIETCRPGPINNI